MPNVINRAQRRFNHRVFSKRVFKSVFEARSFLIEQHVTQFQRDKLWLSVKEDATDQEISNILFTIYGARIIQKTKPVVHEPPANLERGAHFVRVKDSGKKYEEFQLGGA